MLVHYIDNFNPKITHRKPRKVEFNKAAEDVKKLSTQPNDQELLELYGLYKQSTVGDCDTGMRRLSCFVNEIKISI